MDKTIEIEAKAARVWDVLTRGEYTDEWAKEFSSGGPQFHIESTWKLGSPVEWKSPKGTVLVRGTVTALIPKKLLRFTAFDSRDEKPEASVDDGISFELREKDGVTSLHLLQGDFAAMEDGETYWKRSEEVWSRVLPTIQRLAEE